MHRSHFSALAGPLSLILLPKCPLCFASILTAVGVVIPGALGLSVVAAVILAAWVALLFVTTHGRNALRIAVLAAATVSFVGVAAQVRPMLWAGVVAMTLAALAASRACAVRRS